MAQKNKSTNIIEVDRLILIIALVGVVVVSACIGFIFGIVASPLDYTSNINPAYVVGAR